MQSIVKRFDGEFQSNIAGVDRMDRLLSTPRSDPTSRDALERVTRTERPAGLWVSLEELCGDALIEAYRRLGLAYYEAK